MAEDSRYPGNEQVEEDVHGEGGEGKRNADGTPKVADDAVKGQTTVLAPPHDASEAHGEPSEEVKDPHP
jgi:hypothetical protein